MCHYTLLSSFHNAVYICFSEKLNFIQDIFSFHLGFTVSDKSESQINYNDRVASILQCDLSTFPCKYLGLQLAINQLTRAAWQPLLDLVRKFIPSWQRGFIQRAGRLVLVKAVIAARPVQQLLILEARDFGF